MELKDEVTPLHEANEPAQEPGDEVTEGEAIQPMPFGLMGITILCNLTQYAVFLGVTVAILAIVRICAPK